ETLDAATAATEAIILGLRTDLGVATAGLADPVVIETIAWARDLELVTVDPDDRVRLTTRGRLLSNELFARLV
ncbi:MAG: radical SAM family heme chaperone HemW, partial [Candidatus Limnocylindrales bacterium]